MLYRIKAKGRATRHQPGTMNKTEAAYAAQLELRKRAGDVLAYWFEAWKFRLAEKTFYTPDFVVMLPDGTLEAHEVKGGYWEDDARVKIKIFAAQYPLRTIAVKAKTQREGGGWEVEEF